MLGEGVDQCVHYRVENGHRQRVTLEYSNAQLEGCSGPLLGTHNTSQVCVQVGDGFSEVVRSMVVLEREPDQVMMDTSLGYVQPANGDDLCFRRASSIIANSLRWCSLQPGMPLTKAFWMDVLRYPLLAMKCCHLRLRMEV